MRARLRHATDPLLAAATTLFAVVSLGLEFEDGSSISSPVAYVAVLIAGAAMLARTRDPVLVLVAVAASRILVAAVAGNGLALMPAAVVALYTVAGQGERRKSLLTATIVAVLMMVVVAYLDDDQFVHELIGEGGQMLLPIAIADAARTRADRIRDLIESEAEVRLHAERLRIARDLHDVVAHSLSTIAVQSGVAAHLLPENPQQAKEALHVINATGKKSLEELRSMVGVLRSTDLDPLDPLHPLQPTPTNPDDLTEVLGAAERSGVSISRDVQGTFPDDVADATVLALHRILQEALTNVARHAGPVTASVAVVHSEDFLTVAVTNPLPDQPLQTAPSTGVGIIGMRERADALGGTLVAEPGPDHTFVVTARLPYRPRNQAKL